MAAEDWVRFAEDVAPEVVWACVEDGLGNLILIASHPEVSEPGVHLAMPVGGSRNNPATELAEAIRALAEDVRLTSVA